MEKNIEKSTVVCPKCKSKDLHLYEAWNNHIIDWHQKDGKFDRSDGNMDPGDPTGVYAKCEKCKYYWEIPDAIQIDDVIEYDENK